MRSLPVSALAIWLTFAMLTYSSSTARAQPARSASEPAGDEPQAYKAVIKQALQEFDAGNFAEARALFLRAHELAPSARTLRALGLTEFQLRHYVEADKLLEQALQDSRHALTREQRTEVEHMLERARAYVGRYRIQLTPAGATLAVDGQAAALDPGAPLLLDVGEHTLLVRAEGYADEERHLDVRGREDESLSIELHAKAPEAPGATEYAADGGGARPAPAADTRSSNTAAWITVGVSGAVFVAGGVLLAIALSDVRRVEHPAQDTRIQRNRDLVQSRAGVFDARDHRARRRSRRRRCRLGLGARCAKGRRGVVGQAVGGARRRPLHGAVLSMRRDPRSMIRPRCALNVRAPAATALALLALVACKPTVPNGVLSCTNKADCPSEYVCLQDEPSRRHCYRSGTSLDAGKMPGSDDAATDSGAGGKSSGSGGRGAGGSGGGGSGGSGGGSGGNGGGGSGGHGGGGSGGGGGGGGHGGSGGKSGGGGSGGDGGTSRPECSPSCRPGTTCVDQDDCGSRQCSGSCQLSDTGEACDVNDDCSSNGECVQNVCHPACAATCAVGKACATDSDCDSSRCVDALCRPACSGSCSPCTKDTDCSGTGSSCDPTDKVCLKVCTGGSGVGISVQQDLVDYHYCKEINGDFSINPDFPQITASDLPYLTQIDGKLSVQLSSMLTDVTLPKLKVASGGVTVAALANFLNIDLPELTSAGFTQVAATSCETISMPKLATCTGLNITGIQQLTHLDMRSLTTVDGTFNLSGLPALTSANMSAVTQITGSVTIGTLCSLPQASLSAVLVAAGNPTISDVGCCPLPESGSMCTSSCNPCP